MLGRRIRATRNVSRAKNKGTPSQRREARLLRVLTITNVSMVVGLAGYLAGCVLLLG